MPFFNRYANVRYISAVTASIAMALSPSSAQAQVIEWIEVPNVVVPAWVGSNTMARQDAHITFDAIADGQYVRYSANCQSEVLYRLKIGTLDQNNQPQDVAPYPNERWFRASEYQSAILLTACDASR